MQKGNPGYCVRELHEEYHPGDKSLPRWGYGVSTNGVNGIFTAEETEDSRFRRLMAHGVSDKALQDIEPIFQKNTNAYKKAASVSEAVIRILQPLLSTWSARPSVEQNAPRAFTCAFFVCSFPIFSTFQPWSVFWYSCYIEA